jgi:hypothetical protein
MDLEDRKLTSQGGDEPKARASAREARPWSREDNKLHAEGSGCPQLHRPAATGQRWSPFTTTRSYGASWRTRRSRRTGRWLPARYGASRRSADSTGAWPARSVVLRARRDPSTSAEAPIWRHHRDATARRSGADDLCSRSGAFRVFRERARSAFWAVLSVRLTNTALRVPRTAAASGRSPPSPWVDSRPTLAKAT